MTLINRIDLDENSFDYLLTSTLGLNTAPMRGLRRPSLVKTLTTFEGHRILVIEIHEPDSDKQEEALKKDIRRKLLPVLADYPYCYFDIILRYRDQ